ncbi:MAG: hypothetical protein HWE23_10835 [Rhodobacteraceae bacterium]|nr:hypothetical protein [Paracoccaceae bacterium]
MASSEETSNVEHLSPFALKMQEKMNELDGLKERASSLNSTFDQMSSFAIESQASIQMLSRYIDQSRSAVETEIRLKSDNAKMTTELLDREHRVKLLTTQLEDSQAELHSLRKRSTETRTALETARNEIVSIRDNNKKTNEEYRQQSADLVVANRRVAELSAQVKDIEAKYESLEKHAQAINTELEAIRIREKELQQNLSESAKLLEAEIRKNNAANTELEANKRELSEFRTENVDLKSKLEVVNQELNYSKSRLEDEQRKHDNEAYALNAEIENLSSQRRVGAQSLQEMARDNSSLKDRNRELARKMQEIEHLLENVQKTHEQDREELVATSAKLRELNLRYNSALTDLNHQKRQSDRYAHQIEELIEENKRLQHYKLEVDASNDQIVQLKSLVNSYQMAMEGRGPAEELGITYDGSAKADLFDNDADAEPDDILETVETETDEESSSESNVVKLKDD